MRVTFLIGNGFDLNLGLRTTYKDFLENKYLIDYKNEKDPVIKKFKEFIINSKGQSEDVGFGANYWKDVEIAFGESTNSQDLFQNGYEWQKCYDSFCDELLEYLKEEENKINCEKLAQLFFNDIQNFYDKLFIDDAIGAQGIVKSEIKNCEFNFIDFNYTLIIDRLVEFNDKFLQNDNSIGKVYHIHGDLNSGIILGVDNVGQVKNRSIFDPLGSYSLRHFVKPTSMDIKIPNIKNNAYRTIKASDIIIVYGCSLGDTDKTWRDYLCECINNNKIVIITKKDELIKNNNVNSSKRDFLNAIEKTRDELAVKIHLYNYFETNGVKNINNSARDTSDYYKNRYLKYGHLNLFKNLKQLPNN